MSSRSYGQYCGLARALDVVGGRWSLLIVRELLGGPARFNELHAGLPGIATNLLTDRLRDLEAAGVVHRALATDSNAVTYGLTPWGEQLREVVSAFVRWSGPLMISGPQGDQFRPHWLVVAIESLTQGRRGTRQAAATFEVEGSAVTVRADPSGIRVGVGADPDGSTLLRGEAAVILGLVAGLLPVDQATAAGEFHGDPDELTAAVGLN